MSDQGIDLRGMLDGIATSAFRLETRRAYSLGYERRMFDDFLAGREVTPPPDTDWYRPWLDRVRRLTATGRRIQRVRVVDEPITDYQRYAIWTGAWNTAAGEDIRYMAREVAATVGLPGRDWWLLDGQTVVVLNFDAFDRLSGRELIVSPSTVSEFVERRDLALTLAPASEQAA